MNSPVTPLPTPRVTVLELPAGALRRNLTLQLGIAHLSVVLSLPGERRGPQLLAYASEELCHCHLEIQRSSSCLWVQRTAFDLTAAEVLRVRTALEPLGLRVQEIR